jgi:hypothetical protein
MLDARPPSGNALVVYAGEPDRVESLELVDIS